MSELYWLIVLGRLNVLLLVLTIILPIVGVIAFGILAGEGYEDKAAKILKSSLIGAIVSVAGFIFIPDKQDLYVIFGLGAIVDYLQDNRDAEEIPNNVMKLANEYLKEIINKKSNNE